jgi:hypothetical protein
MSDTEPRWMSYRELAEELEISLRAAEARARRQVRAGHWRHRNDNDALKTARVLVPPADLAAMRQGTEGDTVPDTRGNTQGNTDPHIFSLMLAELKAAHERELAVRDAVTAELRQNLSRAEREAVQLREDVARERARADEERTARQAADGSQERALAERDATRAELASWTAGGALERALRALMWRRTP